jgi:hypothetical protein
MSPSRMAPVAPSVQEATTPATHVLRAKGSIQVRTQNMAEGRLGGRTQGIGSRQYHLKVGCRRTCWSLPHSHRRAIHHPFCSCCRRPLCPAATICRTRLKYLRRRAGEVGFSCHLPARKVPTAPNPAATGGSSWEHEPRHTTVPRAKIRLGARARVVLSRGDGAVVCSLGRGLFANFPTHRRQINNRCTCPYMT